MLIALLNGTREISYYITGCLIAAAGYLLKVLFSIWSTSVSHTATYEVLRQIRRKLTAYNAFTWINWRIFKDFRGFNNTR